MSVEDQADSQVLREARDGVRSLQFFVAAMAAQLRDMHDRLENAETAIETGGQGVSLEALQTERDAALVQVEELRQRLDGAEGRNASLQLELQRRNVTFADHHAAKQEIARLRAELDAAQAREPDETARDGVGDRWRRPFNRG